jgi:hypothetical protein
LQVIKSTREKEAGRRHGSPFEALENAPFLKKRSTGGERNIEERGIGTNKKCLSV